MAHRRFTHFFRRRAPAARVVAALVAYGLPRVLHAQSSPAPVQQASPQLAPYRTPVIALVQPASGGTVPQDKPVVVFRFAQGEPDDAIDAKSFAVSIDGVDVTPGFLVVGSEAWGSLVRAVSEPLAAGVHQVNARICSARGACGSASASVSVEAGGITQPAAASPAAKHGHLLDLVVRAARKLLLP